MKKVLLPVFALLFSTSTFAASKGGGMLDRLVREASRLTGKKYIKGGKLKGDIHLSKNLKLTKDNADILLSHILNENGYTRIPIEGTNGYRIINARDVRYTPVPHVYANKTTSPTLPDTADYHMLTYTFSEGEYGITTEVTRSLRPFMSRYGRIIDIKSQRKIVLQDTALNIKRLYKIIKDLDKELPDELKKEKEENQEHRRKIELLKAENCSIDHKNKK